ncbi:hypothetical protein TOPH_00841 [Tolypocladium ophioglossoides CBS 100239]|uniref:Uncharacterized protein n=1 Tax=Tolypocladium ophioglossoides (strain CBS 100239) TaxID=1163406 RepID=A0A0L0NJI1_TOLOC|nr:hypothetical protein TOPH_00841 [Tolypocladium ophioglossoides CBS 100239]
MDVKLSERHRIHLGRELLLPLLAAPAPLDGAPRNPRPVLDAQGKGVLHAAAVVNARDAEVRERRGDGLGSGLLAGVRSEPRARLRDAAVYVGEQLGREVLLARHHAEAREGAVDEMAPVQHRVDEHVRVREREVPQDAHDVLDRHAELALCPPLRRQQPLDDDVVRDAPRRVRLGVEEDLRVAHALARRLDKVCPRQRLEIVGRDEHTHAQVVVEEVIETGEAPVAGEQRLSRRVRRVRRRATLFLAASEKSRDGSRVLSM